MGYIERETLYILCHYVTITFGISNNNSQTAGAQGVNYKLNVFVYIDISFEINYFNNEKSRIHFGNETKLCLWIPFLCFLIIVEMYFHMFTTQKF